jgi:hypothetical protein
MIIYQGNQLTLDQTITYQIKVPGEIDFGSNDWISDLMVSVEREGDVIAATVLTGKFDQAALHSLLRRLYTLGLPLISVVWRGES